MKRAFAIAAHPDDIEFLMAGTLIRLKQAGYEIHYMNVSSGACGTAVLPPEEIIRTRREESQAAAASIGAIYHESIAADLLIFFEQKTLAKLASVVREVAPEILLIQSPIDYMEDHQNTVRLAVTAAFSRNMKNFITDPPRDITRQEVTIYHVQPYGNRDPMRQIVMPEIFVDIKDVLEEKTRMLACHQSQKIWLDESQGMDSYLLNMKDMCHEIGELSGVYRYAEGWRRRLHYGFCSEHADPLSDALKPFTTRRYKS